MLKSGPIRAPHFAHGPGFSCLEGGWSGIISAVRAAAQGDHEGESPRGTGDFLYNVELAPGLVAPILAPEEGGRGLAIFTHKPDGLPPPSRRDLAAAGVSGILLGYGATALEAYATTPSRSRGGRIFAYWIFRVGEERLRRRERIETGDGPVWVSDLKFGSAAVWYPPRAAVHLPWVMAAEGRARWSQEHRNWLLAAEDSTVVLARLLAAPTSGLGGVRRRPQ